MPEWIGIVLIYGVMICCLSVVTAICAYTPWPERLRLIEELPTAQGEGEEPWGKCACPTAHTNRSRRLCKPLRCD